MNRNTMIEELTKHELKYLIENRDALKDTVRFFADGGFNRYSDEELTKQCVWNDIVEEIEE